MNLRSDNFLRDLKVCGKAVLWVLGLAVGLSHADAISNESRRTAVASLESRTLNFERNDGQYGVGPAFVSRGPSYYLTVAPTQVRVTLRKNSAAAAKPDGSLLVKTSGRSATAPC
jgi:hypothetical protein